MALLIFKSLHIIGFVSWFAGLFYLVRMFVYHEETYDRSEPERSVLAKQFGIMENRVYKIICNPAMMITWTCGLSMLWINPAYLTMGWMHMKLTLLVLLVVYHLYCKRLIARYNAGERPFDSFQLRMMNEMPTLFLVTIVFLASLKSGINYLYLVIGLLIFVALLYRGARAYQRRREQQST